MIDLNMMRKSGSILAETLDYLFNNYIRSGVSAWDISSMGEEIIRSYEGATPAFLGYSGFPASFCVSVNEEVVHAIPRKDRVLQPGDIVSVDGGVIYEEHYSDACRTTYIEKTNKHVKKLLKTTEGALSKGIEAATAGNRVGDISYAIQHHVERNRFTVSLDFTGHGIGKELHLPPQILNYGPPGRGAVLNEGTCLAIEPVVFDGQQDVMLNDDGWTVVSSTGCLSAHFEDTIIISKGVPEVITRLST